MAPAAQKTNFKSYDAQARLLRAIVAAHPEVRWNYKEITKHFGSDMTESACEHRFRTIKTHSKVMRQAVAQGVDCFTIPGDLPKDEKDIAKFFGESTADGIQFQFRSIKKDAEALKTAANAGGNPATALNLSGGAGPSSAVSTPRKATPSRVRASGGGRSTKKARTPVKQQPASDEDDEGETDYNAVEDTPSKSRHDRVLNGRVSKAQNGIRSTPSRAATTAAASKIADIANTAAVDLTTSDSEPETEDSTTEARAQAKATAVRQSMDFLAAPPATQTAAGAYTAPSSFGQESISDPFATSMDDAMTGSFAEQDYKSIFGNGNAYMDNEIGEI
ncbi:hypothetical protein C8035_v000118 [Colletotrichum spinosum]|uniref:Myb-like domain-containing protein n=1 Tax=Colletotrichum spinosum TaxID=1347390 RepID=A0A4R8PUD0_9PEZI|nr:hypothetical protein C8035_v000118 [Colletotrichum spinosum]